MKYIVYRMNRLDEHSSITEIDGFMFFNSSENRVRSVIDYLYKNNILPKEILEITISDNKDETKFLQKENYNSVVFKSTFINVDLSGSLISCLKAVNEYVRDMNIIGIDISTMPIPIFTQILHFLFEKHNDKQIVIYYTEPTHYNLDNVFDFNALSGEIDLKAIPGFEGKTSQKNELKRIIFYILGFELNYLNRLIPQDMNPDGIVPINGFPSFFPKYKDISLINNGFNYHEKDIKIVFAEANNPFETYNQMCLLKNTYPDYCIDIIPAGTKPMALGACLFALKNGNNDVRVLFPFPTEYKIEHSIGKGQIWEYVIT